MNEFKMGKWAVILNIVSFEIIHITNITPTNIEKVVKTGLMLDKAINLASELNKTLDRHEEFR